MRIQFGTRLLIDVLALAMLAPVVMAQDEPRLSLYAWAERNQSGAADPFTTFGASVDGSVPIMSGLRQLARLNAELDLSAAPGVQLDVANVDTFGRVIGFTGSVDRQLVAGEVGHKDIRLYARARAGFLTALSEDRPVDRYWRHYSAGPALEVSRVGGGRPAEVYLGYGWDERSGPEFHMGQLQVVSTVPLVGITSTADMILGLEAVLNIGSPERGRVYTTQPRDMLKIYVGFSYNR